MSDEIKKMEKQLGQLGKEVPSVMNCFMKLDQECVKDGVLSHKVKELMAMAIGIAIRCKPCIQFHTAEAVKAGANKEEILEAASVSVFMGGGPAVAYIATELLPVLDELKVE
ncbi:MAG: carboxymuconolactone decarboxylase family protein [Atribacterota bacterium]|jgi:AhpD family alkylhydroperoxidase|nr:carboxymuconolactone decarboxylase family protein [Atribacterota bacterium]